MVFPSSRFMSLKGWSKTLKPPLKHRASFACVIGSSLGKDSFMSCRVVHLVWGCLEGIWIQTPTMTRALLDLTCHFLLVDSNGIQDAPYIGWIHQLPRTWMGWKKVVCIFVGAVCHIFEGGLLPEGEWEWTPMQSSFFKSPASGPGLPTRWSRLGEGGGNGHPDSFKCEFDKIEMRHADVFL